MSEIQSTAFEVRCEDCDVSFPVGTKWCFHCGERIGRAHRKAPTALFGGEPVVFEEGEAIDRIDEPEEAPRGGRGLRMGFTMIWLLLAGISALVRSCQGQ